MPRHILQLHRPAADHAESRQRRHVERDYLRLRRDLRADAKGLADEHIDIRLHRRALTPRIESDEDRARARLRAEGQDIETVDGHDHIDAGQFLERSLHFVHALLRDVGRRAGRQTYGNDVKALIFIRYEGRRHVLVNDRRKGADEHHEENGETRLANHLGDNAQVAALRLVKPRIEAGEEAVENALLVCLALRVRLQDQSAKSRR